MLHALHAIWTVGENGPGSGGARVLPALHVFGEDATKLASVAEQAIGEEIVDHPFALDVEAIRGRLGKAGEGAVVSSVIVQIPVTGSGVLPSSHLARAVGYRADGVMRLAKVRVPTLAVAAEHAPAALDAMLDDSPRAAAAENGGRTQLVGASVVFFGAASRLVRSLLAAQRFVPMIAQGGVLNPASMAPTPAPTDFKGVWQPWLSDEKTAERVATLVRSMPSIARAVVDSFGHQPWPIVEDFLWRVVDAQCRATLTREDFYSSVAEKDATKDLHVAWLQGLLSPSEQVPATATRGQELARRVRQWISGLEERGASSAWRLLLKMNEPLVENDEDDDDAMWSITFHLQSVDKPALIVDAADLWALTGDSMTIEGKRIDSPQELLLGELGRASRIYQKLEKALEDSEPESLELGTRQAYQFLREFATILAEQGFGIQTPDWWDSPLAKLGVRLRLESDTLEKVMAPGGGAAGAANSPQLGMSALVRYRWEIALGDAALSLAEFEKLAARKSPLVRMNGRWVEVRPEDVQSAIKFVREHPGGEMKVGEALRMAYASDPRETGVHITGLEATGWVAALMNAEAATQQLEMIRPPERFHGTLRPYQVRGVSWMAFLERIGLGLCLADDMGLGKTIQLLALMAFEREQMQAAMAKLPPGSVVQTVKPTLLVVPMSVVGNWLHETKRFCPELKVLTHHGADRLDEAKFVDEARSSDMVITTYSLAHRDRELLTRVEWGRVVLDEAQYIKNPAAKQSQAVRAITAERRVALTGTPVENRLSELWSIMDFLNPGYLGSAGSFRTRFSLGIERYRDKAKLEQLKGLVRPFILRRLKSDPTVVADLPEKVESKEFCPLTSEQATLYEQCVQRMLAEVERSEGIQRRGLVLSALIKLKQICNHPSQLLKDWSEGGLTPPKFERSGKCIRLLEMLEEVLAEGDQALVFTQFRQMGNILMSLLRHHLDRDVIFLHGGSTQKERVDMVERFQKGDGRHPILLISLKAGGVGLNLTAASHVFHFDRWWNPAVENQATDRAYRIGQTRTVQVHKFVVRGTLEERIDQMIEQKTELAENIIGSGERWLTELDTSQLRELLTLRNDAIADEV
ncbi:MAG: DEAD/DEAH box helicase [Phycisphaerales bacterium]|nr:DEAD/DEAH box helicase [Phycisphaerales bacterium]